MPLKLSARRSFVAPVLGLSLLTLALLTRAQTHEAPAAQATAADAGGSPAHGEWGYSGPTGPEHWADLAEKNLTCAKGQQESPINLQAAIPAQIKKFKVQWNTLPLRVANNGHTLEVEAAHGGLLDLDGRSYELAQFHFHHPSEHLLDGRRFPLELHFVHKRADGVLAVIGVFVEEGRPNPTLQAVLDAAPHEPGKTAEAERRVNPRALLPAGGYFRYEGSLTTPPCSESVDWIVMSKPISASAQQIKAFSNFYPMNARPVQALNRRFLIKRQG